MFIKRYLVQVVQHNFLSLTVYVMQAYVLSCESKQWLEQAQVTVLSLNALLFLLHTNWSKLNRLVIIISLRGDWDTRVKGVGVA